MDVIDGILNTFYTDCIKKLTETKAYSQDDLTPLYATNHEIYEVNLYTTL